jgi:hypothetical protein
MVVETKWRLTIGSKAEVSIRTLASAELPLLLSTTASPTCTSAGLWYLSSFVLQPRQLVAWPVRPHQRPSISSSKLDVTTQLQSKFGTQRSLLDSTRRTDRWRWEEEGGRQRSQACSLTGASIVCDSPREARSFYFLSEFYIYSRSSFFFPGRSTSRTRAPSAHPATLPTGFARVALVEDSQSVWRCTACSWTTRRCTASTMLAPRGRLPRLQRDSTLAAGHARPNILADLPSKCAARQQWGG